MEGWVQFVHNLWTASRELGSSGQLFMAKKILEDCIRICQAESCRCSCGEIDSLLDSILFEYGLLMQKINPIEAVSVWKNVSRRPGVDPVTKTNSLINYLRLLCHVESWTEAKKVSIDAQKSYVELLQKNGLHPGFIQLDAEIRHFSDLVTSKVAEVEERERLRKQRDQNRRFRRTQLESIGQVKKTFGAEAAGGTDYTDASEGSSSYETANSSLEYAVSDTSERLEVVPSTKKKKKKTRKKKKASIRFPANVEYEEDTLASVVEADASYSQVQGEEHQTDDESQASCTSISTENADDLAAASPNDAATAAAATASDADATSIASDTTSSVVPEEPEELQLEDPTDIVPFTWSSFRRSQSRVPHPHHMQSGMSGNSYSSLLNKGPTYNTECDAEVYSPECFFPLEKTHDFTLACTSCSVKSTSQNGVKWKTPRDHPGCSKATLLIRQKEDSSSWWTKIRDRPFREFSGPYQMCWNLPNSPCRRNPETCCFAHSKEEMYIWNVEKYTPFDILTFRAKNRNQTFAGGLRHPQQPNLGMGSSKSPRKHRFPLADTHYFNLGCESCATENNDRWDVVDHPGCLEDILFVKRKFDSFYFWIKIRNRQSSYCRDTYKLCWNFPEKACARGNRETCHFAHSEEEVKIWNAEKSGKFSIKGFKIQNSQIRDSNGNNSSQNQPVYQNATQKHHPASGHCFSSNASMTQSNLSAKPDGDFMANLERTYAIPNQLNQNEVLGDLSQQNYVAKMHGLLYEEEKCQQEMISRVTSILKANVSSYAEVPNGPSVRARRGKKFAKITLNKILSSEGSAGYLIQRNCDKVLLRPRTINGQFTEEAYEAPLVTKHMGYGINGLGNDHLYVFVDERFLEAAQMAETEDDIQIDVWVQFRLNRSSFCAMHFAIDEISTNLAIFFPKSSQSTELQKFDLKTKKLNTQQLKALNQILHHQKGDPMLILYGAFGTGKTMTMSSTALQLMKSDAIEKKSKILICTYSNSAADLFVLLLDDLNKREMTKMQILRVYSKKRHMSTIPVYVRKYILIREGPFGTYYPEMPSLEDVRHANIVITTVHTSLELVKLKVKGIFSHIFLDEAGQTLEPELLIPLSLATVDTCIVLAGDVMQMSPQVYSPDAQQLRISLLQRIFEIYEMDQQSLGNKSEPRHTVSLNENYRNDQLILRFLSLEIYGDEEKLIWKSGIKSKGATLRFHVVQGEEKPGAGTSFYNEEEVGKVEHVLSKLKTDWPPEWGYKDLSKIAVTSMYPDQVHLIRRHLRITGMGAVTVLQMENLQGRQYDIVVISTVHTSKSKHGSASGLDFLSDMKLVNTAISRAKYCVIVVGDAEALCTHGSNMKLWHTYLRLAKERNGLMVQNPGQFINNIERKMDHVDDDDISYEKSIKIARDDMERILKVFEEGKGEDLLLPLLTDDPGITSTEEFIPKNNLERITGVQVLKHIKCDQKQGVASITFPLTDRRIKRKKTKWRPLGSDYHGQLPQFDDDSDASDSDDDGELEPQPETDMTTPENLEAMLQSEQYQRCQMDVSSIRNITAVILEGEMKDKMVVIKHRQHCRRALDGDEVLVGLTRSPLTGDFLKPLQGKVKDVIHRNMNMRYRTIICRIHETNPGLMCPLSTKLPPIYNLRKKGGNHEGHVTMYSMSKNENIIRRKDLKLQNRQDLYVVMYLQWATAKNLPLGIAIGTLPVGNSQTSGQEILEHLHYVPKSIAETSGLAKQCESQFPSSYLDDRQFPDREDLRDKRIFTVDDTNSQDLDDALHIEEHADGNFTVGVHIADVSHYVKRNSDVDKEAYKRGTTFYPANKPPIHMLPQQLGTRQCSLLPDQDKLAVSVLYEMHQNGEIQSIRRLLTVIRSKRKFDYQGVEGILDDVSLQDDWRQDISKLYSFAQIFAEKRKGREGSMGIEDEEAPKAHMLIEEWMVKTNSHVAEYLLTKFRDKVPLRKQIAPTQEELDEWKRKYSNQVAYSFCLQRIANLLQEEEVNRAHDGFVHIFRDTWKELLVYHNEYQILDKIAKSVQNFPEQFCALKSWYAMQKKTVYHCSGNEDHLYYSLGTRAYTHFTSPIRRYIDIVVHRLLKADIKNTHVGYTAEEISQICLHCSGAEKKANEFKGETKLLVSACDLKEWPNEVHVVVKDTNEREIEVLFLAFKNMPHILRAVPFSSLSLKEDPSIEDSIATMKFEQRIYDYGNAHTYPGEGASLDSKQFTVAIPGVLWKRLVDAIAKRNEELALETFETIRANVGDDTSTNYAIDVSSESAVQAKTPQEITFRRDVKPGDVLRVQLATKVNKGVIKPCIQLIKLTPSFHICLEHAHDPIKSFAVEDYHQSQGAGVYDYMKHWLALLTMESAYSISKSNRNQSAHVYNVPAEWSQCSEGVVHGRLKMSQSFCEKRFLLFSIDVLYGTVAKDDGGAAWMELPHRNFLGDCQDWQVTRFGFMCVKFTYKTRDGKSMTWVGHFHITDVLIIHEDVVVYLKLNQSSYDFPGDVLDRSISNTPPCAIHWLDKAIPDVRAESAVLGLLDCAEDSLPMRISQRRIRLSREISTSVNVNIDTEELHPSNEEQGIALKAALNEKNKFVLIWGPPGTGKSVTGAQLAYLFAQNNPSGKQVLYCGPSNKSVNVVTAKLKLLNVEVVRIFSEQLVNNYYPLPNFPTCRPVDDESLKDHKDVALHELIRLPGRPFAEKIAKYNKTFKENPRSVTMQDILKYKKLLGKAYHAELGKAQVILCTCGSSGNGLFKKAFYSNVQQVIVDECGMCTEPETLIPLLACDPKKVVLIGDHKQLQPIISCPKARKHGLDSTLFKGYSSKAVKLKVQYRMHFMIQEFPSKKFYGGDLRLGNHQVQADASKPYENFWPAGSRKPIAFCHVDGVEKTQYVSTGTAGANSHFNMEEVKQVIRVVHALIEGKIDEKEIAILTPYRLQLSKIKEKIQKKGLQNVTINTITNSQGSEWPYVILSTVRSLPQNEIEEDPWKGWCVEKLGFVTDEHQINVAITRAKNGLVIIGNKNLLRCDSTWSDLLDFYEEKEAVTDCDSFPPRTTNNRNSRSRP